MKNPRQYRITFDASLLVALDAPATDIDPTAPVKIKIVGYLQSVVPHCEGGTKNHKCARVRPAALRALARSFVRCPFITAHNAGDVEKRYGTIVGCQRWEDPKDPNIVGLLFDVELNSEGVEVYNKGQIDRFSASFEPGDGPITCTVHKCDIFSDCYCWPGMTVENKADPSGPRLVVEWEYSDPLGLELSAVNVPAVTGTHIVGASVDEGTVVLSAELQDMAAQLDQWAEMAGRPLPNELIAQFANGQRPQGVSPAASEPIKVEPQATKPTEDQTMRDKLIKKFSLPNDATDAQIEAAMDAASASAASSAKTLEATIVDTKVAALQARGLTDDKIVALRKQYADHGLQVFTASADLVDAMLPVGPAPTVGRGKLQSDDPPAPNGDGPSIADGELQLAAMWANNPALRTMAAKVGVTKDQILAHGPTHYKVVSPDSEAGQKIRDAAQ